MRILLFFFCALFVLSCNQSRNLNLRSDSDSSPLRSVNSSIPSAAIEAELRAFAQSWLQTPHMEGGDSKSGIDAPGLMKVIGDQILGLSLPHSTARQLGFGEEVERAFLMPGDMVFFRPTSMPRHVGVYLGSQEFLHAWPDGGVFIARLDEPYWNGAYWAGRRVLNQESTNQPQQTSSDEPPSDPGKRRVGW